MTFFYLHDFSGVLNLKDTLFTEHINILHSEMPWWWEVDPNHHPPDSLISMMVGSCLSITSTVAW